MNERKTGLTDDLNDLGAFCESLKPGDVAVICGEHGVGKTTLALKIANCLAPDAQEMKNDKEAKRTLIFSPVKSSRVIMEAGLSKRYMLIDDCSRLFLDAIVSRTQAVARVFNLKALVIDDFQAVTRQFMSAPGEKRGEIVAALKKMGTELGIPVVLTLPEARQVPCGYSQCNLQFLNELAELIDVCVCLGRGDSGKVSYCMMRK